TSHELRRVRGATEIPSHRVFSGRQHQSPWASPQSLSYWRGTVLSGGRKGFLCNHNAMEYVVLGTQAVGGLHQVLTSHSPGCALFVPQYSSPCPKHIGNPA
ncbi:hypothetical protein HispidOSU_018838, partial [Sigmodon hispidus]